MKLDLVKDGNWFKPAYPEDDDKASKIGDGEIVEAKLWKQRNYQFHKKFFALIKMAYDNHPYEENISMDSFRKLIIMKAGYFETIRSDKGNIYLPESISFEKMSQKRFEELYEKVLEVVTEMIQVKKETVERELSKFM